MIIDFHTHVFPPRVCKKRKDYINADPCFALLYSRKKARLATVDELITSMDKAGVEISVIANIGWATHELCVETNDYILEAVARYPERLVGFGAVQPLAGEAAIAEMERLAHEGIKGIGELRPDIQFIDVGDSQLMDPFVEALLKHRLPLLVHASEPVGHDYPGKGAISPSLLYSLISSYPEVTLICAHWGGGLPFYAMMPEVAEAMKNVYFDSSASPFLYTPQVYQQVIQLVGGERVLFGSDWPLLEPERILKEITSLDLTPETQELLLAGNARRLLDI